MEIRAYQEEVDKWITEVGVRYFDVLTNTILLSEEVGEFSGLIARIYGEQSFKETSKVDHKELLADELADVLFVAACLANQLGLDLENTLKVNLEKKSRRDATRHASNPKLNG